MRGSERRSETYPYRVTDFSNFQGSQAAERVRGVK